MEKNGEKKELNPRIITNIFDFETDSSKTGLHGGAFEFFMEKFIEGGECKKENDSLQAFFEKCPDGFPDGDLVALRMAYLSYSFAVGFVYGQMFELCDKEAVAMASELKQKIIDEGLLKYRPKERPVLQSRGAVTEGNIQDAVYEIDVLGELAEKEVDGLDEAEGEDRLNKLEHISRLLPIIREKAKFISDTF